MKKTVLIGLALLLLVGLSGGIFAFKSKWDNNTRPPVVTTGESTATGTVVEITASNFKYDKTEIKVKKGDKVTMKFTNASGYHDLVIDELQVNTGKLNSGESTELTIPTDKPGTYEYYCSVPGHHSLGMKGTLIVE